MLSWLTDARHPLFLAPMARFTDAVYRQLCKDRGADVMVTEFVRAGSVVHGVEGVWESIDFSESQRPMGVQIYGSEPAIMAEAARIIVDKVQPNFIDINFGCPADKVTCKFAGSAVLRDLPRMQKIVRAVVKAVPSTPVSMKIRIGWDLDHVIVLDAGKIAQEEGACMLTIHARTKGQGYRTPVRWEYIAEATEHLDVPIIGNGDLKNAHDVRQAFEQYGCQGAMIGRAALGYPWLFRDIKHFLDTGQQHPPPSLDERWELIISMVQLMMARPFRAARHKDIQWMRPRILKLTKEMPRSKHARKLLSTVSTMAELEALAQEHKAFCREVE